MQADAGDAAVCDPDSSDTVGCPCDPGTFIPSDCYTGPAGTNGKGICLTGKRSCNPDGTFSACVGEVTPQVEICNYADDDCNGIVDDVKELVEASVLFTCQSPACDPNFTDAAITCWGPDLGICGAGVKSCQGTPTGGKPTGCNEYLHAGVPEICNGLDDDCNGLIDDGLNAEGACTFPANTHWPADSSLLDTTNSNVVLGQCLNGQMQCVDSNCTEHYCADAGDQCYPSPPVAETCNGLDDDCNGIVDDHACASGPNKWCCFQAFCESTDIGGCIFAP